MKKIKYKFSFTIALIIFVLSTIPAKTFDELDPQITNFDKFVHFTMYFTLTYLIVFENILATIKTNQNFVKIFFLCIISILYGGLLEILQGIPFIHRSTDFTDFTFNSLGALTGAFISIIFRKFNTKIYYSIFKRSEIDLN